jgi:hypothetical protein
MSIVSEDRVSGKSGIPLQPIYEGYLAQYDVVTIIV